MKRALVLIIALSLILGFIATGCPPGQQAAPPEDEPFPERTINIIVGFGPGGGMDLLSRALAGPMSEYLGVDVVVSNMPGAGSAIASEYLVQQPADGYTLFAISSAMSTFPATGYSDITHEDIQILNIPIRGTPTFQVPIDSPFQDMGALIEAWKQGGTTASNSGLGGIWHIPQIVAVSAVEGEVTFVPYDGGKPAAFAVASKEVDWGTSDGVEAVEFFNQDLSRPLAVFAAEPFNLPGYGEIPPITNWLPELEDLILPVSGWRGVGLKRGVPEQRLEKLYSAITYAIESESFRKFVEESGATMLNISREEAENVWETSTKVQSWLMYDQGLADRSPEEVGIPRP
jgi:tripartite-type tricarboxylate transporter receptor subunit TctC